MTDWGYDKAALWADPDQGTLFVGGEKIMSAVIEDKKLRMEYGPEWEEFLYSDEKHTEWRPSATSLTGRPAKVKGRGRATWSRDSTGRVTFHPPPLMTTMGITAKPSHHRRTMRMASTFLQRTRALAQKHG